MLGFYPVSTDDCKTAVNFPHYRVGTLVLLQVMEPIALPRESMFCSSPIIILRSVCTLRFHYNGLLRHLHQRRIQSFNQRAKLSRLGVVTASNRFHLHVSSFGILARGNSSELHGYNCRSSRAPFGSSSK